MKHTALCNDVQRLCDSTAKELYNLAYNIYGDRAEALQASSDAFAKAYIQAGNPETIDAEQFMLLSIRFLYKNGSKGRHIKMRDNHELSAAKENKLLIMLHPLSYHERFIILLFCRHKLQKEQISELLSLPKFLVTKWLLSATQKLDKLSSETQLTEGILTPVSSHF